MTLATNTLDVEAEGGVFPVDLSSNVYYRVNNDCQIDGSDNYWAVIDSYETQGEMTRFMVKISENTSTVARVGAIRFIGDAVTPLKLVINQKMITPKGISPVSESVDDTTTEASFKVYGDKAWSAVCDDPDVSITPANGIGECDVKLTFPANKTFNQRTIKVTVTIQDDKDYTYTLVQDAFSGVLAKWELKALTDRPTSESLVRSRCLMRSDSSSSSLLSGSTVFSSDIFLSSVNSLK